MSSFFKQREYDKQVVLQGAVGPDPSSDAAIMFATARSEYLKYKQQKFTKYLNSR